MRGWKVLPWEAPHPGAWQMALDEALFREAEEGREVQPVLRLYRWAPPCLSLGRHQDPAVAADGAFCRARGIDVVRRPTGGLAVLHDDEVTYAVAAPLDRPPFEGLNLAETYGRIAGALLEGLRSLGLPAELSRRRTSPTPVSAAPCFQVPTENEVLVHGRKVVGSAQRRGRRAFLQHGAVPLSVDYRLLLGATGRSGEDEAPYRAAFAGLRDFLPGLTAELLRDALLEGFRRTLEWP
ncbi:MAG: lipoate--protein ligase family protein [Acidobacteriota bacterium]